MLVVQVLNSIGIFGVGVGGAGGCVVHVGVNDIGSVGVGGIGSVGVDDIGSVGGIGHVGVYRSSWRLEEGQGGVIASGAVFLVH